MAHYSRGKPHIDSGTAALETVEAGYEQYFQSLFTPEQQQKFALFEAESGSAVDALGLGPSAEQDASREDD